VLSRRTQILLDDGRYAQLHERAEREGSSVGAVIREAIDLLLDDDAHRRQGLVESFLAADPVEVSDWPDVEREIEGSYDRTLGLDEPPA
jgi:hypothetical protein